MYSTTNIFRFPPLLVQSLFHTINFYSSKPFPPFRCHPPCLGFCFYREKTPPLSFRRKKEKKKRQRTVRNWNIRNVDMSPVASPTAGRENRGPEERERESRHLENWSSSRTRATSERGFLLQDSVSTPASAWRTSAPNVSPMRASTRATLSPCRIIVSNVGIQFYWGGFAWWEEWMFDEKRPDNWLWWWYTIPSLFSRKTLMHAQKYRT